MTNSVSLSLQQLEEAIANSKPKVQRQLLADLPKILKMKASDLVLLKESEPSFEFWDNPEDQIYDSL